MNFNLGFPTQSGFRFICISAFAVLFFTQTGLAQRFNTDDYTDTTLYQKGLISLYKKFDRIRLSGYVQPQFQFAEAKGAKGYAGGDFPEHVNNRFTMRRGRFRLDYSHHTQEGLPSIFFVFQFDGTERGFFTRDFFGRYYENKWSLFNLTAGIFSRPFGFEVNLGSADRESPERGRMSQILMKIERDIGAMVSFHPQRKDHPLKNLKVDVGLFNGQGVTNTINDFDSHKDLIGRIAYQKINLGSAAQLNLGASVLYGGMEQFTSEVHRMSNGKYEYSNVPSNVGKIAPRHYYGGDLQLFIPNGPAGSERGSTEIRAEYIAGTQTGTQNSSDSPAVIPVLNGGFSPLYVRPFNGAYFYLLQPLFSKKHQLGIKYDWYDPNTQVAGEALNNQFTAADVRFNTLGLGYNYFINDNMRLVLWYDIVKNESTSFNGFEGDVKDNVFTTRLQFRF